MELTEIIRSNLRNVKSWEVPEIVGNKPFTKLSLGAETERFDKRLHLGTRFSGPVINLGIYDHSVVPSAIIDAADFAYIDNGRIVYSEREKTVHPTHYGHVSWRADNFRIDEVYEGRSMSLDTPVLKRRNRTAHFTIEEKSLGVDVEQFHTGEIRIILYKINGTEKSNSQAVYVDIDPEHNQYADILNQMKANPKLFMRPEEIVNLLQGLESYETIYAPRESRAKPYCQPFETKHPRQETSVFEKSISEVFPDLVSN